MLEQWGYHVLVEDFMEIVIYFVVNPPGGFLMDIGFYSTIYHWCQEIRKRCAIMFLSSRDRAMDIVMAISLWVGTIL